jgi:hypothetical protein
MNGYVYRFWALVYSIEFLFIFKFIVKKCCFMQIFDVIIIFNEKNIYDDLTFVLNKGLI